eukprot:6198580-Pleurochrysis_carterae.AAC.2
MLPCGEGPLMLDHSQALAHALTRALLFTASLLPSPRFSWFRTSSCSLRCTLSPIPTDLPPIFPSALLAPLLILRSFLLAVASSASALAAKASAGARASAGAGARARARARARAVAMARAPDRASVRASVRMNVRRAGSGSGGD